MNSYYTTWGWSEGLQSLLYAENTDDNGYKVFDYDATRKWVTKEYDNGMSKYPQNPFSLQVIY